MKKMRPIGIIVLLALITAACGGVMSEPEAEDPALPKIVGKTDDGREIMEITIGGVTAGGKARALTDPLAQAKINFYEVAFKNGTEVYRATWNKGYPATVRVPVSQGSQTYNDADNAILFAGRESDKTLLAVGIITEIDNNGTLDTTTGRITTSTTSVKFTLYPLLNNISDTTADTTFKITAPATHVTTDPIETLTLAGGEVIPVFSVPKNGTAATAVTAEYRVDIGTDTTPADGVGDQTANHNKGIILDLAADTNYSPFAFLNSSLNESSTIVTIANPTVVPAPATPPAETPFPADGKFALTFDTPDIDGYAELSMGIKAYAITMVDKLVDWNIKGGLNKTVLDDPSATDSEGGAVLLKVGEPSVFNNVNVGSGF